MYGFPHTHVLVNILFSLIFCFFRKRLDQRFQTDMRKMEEYGIKERRKADFRAS